MTPDISAGPLTGAAVEAATFVAFLEGPAADAHGTVYFSDLRANRIPIPTDTITNCCFGGSDKRTLYVTAGHMLYRTRVNVPGYHVHPD